MKGRIKNYNEQKGFGFILGNDNQDYFFHISDVNTFEPLKIGDFVEFVPSENKKGQCAKKVKVSSKSQSAKFVQIENTNIRVSNIKNYGIAKDKYASVPRRCFYEVKVKYTALEQFFSVIDALLNSDVTRINSGEDVFLVNPDDCSKFGKAPPYSKGEVLKDKCEVVSCELIEEKEKIVNYLYVTTFQGDNYQFYNDIYKYKAMLDNLLK